jgi:hypothetical protein
MFLARLPKALPHAGEQPQVLEQQDTSEQEARSPGFQDLEAKGLAGCPDLGTRDKI